MMGPFVVPLCLCIEHRADALGKVCTRSCCDVLRCLRRQQPSLLARDHRQVSGQRGRCGGGGGRETNVEADAHTAIASRAAST